MTSLKKITLLSFFSTLFLFSFAKKVLTEKVDNTDKGKTLYFANGTIGNYVWRDINGDGLNNEPFAAGINGVTVELHKETSPGSNTYTLQTSMATANDASGKPGYYLFTITTSANYRVKFPLTNSGVSLTTQTITPATDNNSDANLTTGFSPTIAINVTGSGVALNNITIDAGYHCNNSITTTNYTIEQGSTVPAGQGLTAVSSNMCGLVSGVTLQIPINIPTSPVDDGTNPVPLGTATMPALPVGSALVSVKISIANVEALATVGSFKREVRVNLSGAITHLGEDGSGDDASSGVFTYANDIENNAINVAGGSIALSYYELYNDDPNNPDATFPTGMPAPNAFITIVYDPPPLVINWYTTPVGGSAIGSGNPFNPVGIAGSGVPNTNTGGSTIFYATCSNNMGCRAPAIFSVTVPCTSLNVIGGTVFDDKNNNGVKDAIETFGFEGIRVNAINSAGQIIDFAFTNGKGAYTLENTNAASGPMMIQFDLTTFPSNFVISKLGADNKSDLQFTTAPNCNVSLGLVSTLFGTTGCSSNPDVVVAKFQAFAPTTANVLVKFPYNSNSQSPLPTSLNSPGTLLGAVWGLAYQANSNKLFSSAVMRRHTAFGTGGTGGIYVTDISSNTSSLYLNLNNFPGIDLGLDPHDNNDLFNDQIVDDNNPFDSVGKISFGGMEFSTDGKNLFVVNLKQRKIHKIFTNNPAVPGSAITAANITTFNVPNPGCTNGTYRPWALKYFNDKLYVGVVCDGSGGPLGTGTNQFAYVYEMNPSTGTFIQVLSFPLNYPKGSSNSSSNNILPNDRQWNNWISDWNSCSPAVGDIGVITYPQPILGDIEIDINGDMILGFLDRFGMQGASGSPDLHGNPAPARSCGGPTRGYIVLASGDILRAGKCNGTSWSLETNASVCGAQSTSGALNNQGPGQGEFYFNESFSEHEETSLGSLALLAGKNEVLGSVFDPLDYFSNGTLRLNNTNGALIASYEITPNNGANPFGKSNSLGDIELLCDATFRPPPPIRIGNRLWVDTDLDGVQDANENGLPNVTLTLWKASVKLATVTTNANGEFSFSSASGGGGVVWTGTGADTTILPLTNYQIRADMTQPVLRFYDLTIANSTANIGTDQTDSDGILTSTLAAATATAVISLTTGNSSQSNYTSDFGFLRNSVVPITFINISAAKQDQAIAVNWLVGVESNISHYIVEKSTNGINFTAIGTVTANNSAQYKLLDVAPVSGRNYYRIKAVELNNTNKFSNTISVLNSAKATIQIIPNPAKDNITLSGLNGKSTITIYSMDGKVAYKRSTSAFALSESIDLTDFASGKYFIQIVTDSGITNKQFQVVK